MTRVDFYTGSEDKLRTACQLSQKAMQSGMRVLLHVPDAETANRLDKLLWHYPPTAFMPHCHSGDAEAGDMPVVIACDENFPHSELLISLHDECPTFFSRFERVIEIVGHDAEDAARGRNRFKFYRDRGYELKHTDLAKLRA
ncbi:MAG: DNA polymerase III subunit chi [Sideroxydans sp.]|nr:DNA polymerase III subunit chi [Sideroxydans sp.]